MSRRGSSTVPFLLFTRFRVLVFRATVRLHLVRQPAPLRASA